MKEYTEIKMVNSKYENPDFLEIENNLFFRFEDEALKMLVGGRPIKIENENIVFETQGFYERIPKREANNGTKVEIFKDWRKEDKIGDGVIQKKYFTKAKKEDWKLEKELTENNSKEIKFDMTFTQEEKEILEMGNTPIQMEDKWFIFQEENKIRFFRSWTGIEFYKGELKIRNDKKWEFNKFWIHLDNNEMDKEKEKSMFKRFLEVYLESRKKVFK